MTLDELNRLSPAEATAAFRRCCGASRWVETMSRGLPYSSPAGVLESAESAADGLAREDWLEAFSHHPRIGDVAALRERFASTAAWASDEQRGAAAASERTLEALAAGNRAYEERFGYIFIVCATGRSADEMLGLLRARLDNDPDREASIAAEEQRRITRLRLHRLLEIPE